MAIDFTTPEMQVSAISRSSTIGTQHDRRRWFDWLQHWKTLPQSLRQLMSDYADAWISLRLASATYKLSPPRSVTRLSGIIS